MQTSNKQHKEPLEQSNEGPNTMDELRAVLEDLGTTLNEAVAQARRAGFLARRLGVPAVDEQIEDEVLPVLVALADDTQTATQPGAVGQLLALLEKDA